MRSERGSIIVHVAFALVPLLCFLGIILDQGALYVTRAQAQNAADAGALAGALELLVNPSGTANAQSAAEYFAGTANAVWGQGVGSGNTAVKYPHPCPDKVDPNCIRVDVYRGLNRAGAATGNPISTFLMSIVGVNQQRIRATAAAQIAAGNIVSKCIKPFAVADKWSDNSGTGLDTTQWDQMDSFEGGTDVYTVPGFKATGPGNDYGLQLMLKGDVDWSAGWSLELELGGGNGAPPYEAEIGGCPSWVPPVGLYDGSIPCGTRADTNEPKGCVNVNTGVRAGPTGGGIATLVALDPGAAWDVATKSVQGGCTAAGTCQGANPAGIDISPRVVPIAIFNPQSYLDTGCSGNGCVAEVVNLLGFFVEGMCDQVYPSSQPAWCGAHPDKTVVGRLMAYPGQHSSVSGPAGPATFLRFTRLVQ